MRKHLYRGFYKCDDGDKVIKVNDKKIKGKWIIGWYVGKTCDSLFGGAYESSQIISENSLCWYEVVPKTVCECIDLSDKNGKKIFEGDIVKDERNNYARVAFLPQECGYVLVYKKFDTRLGHRNRGGGYFCDMALEVIGNIFESELTNLL